MVIFATSGILVDLADGFWASFAAHTGSTVNVAPIMYYINKGLGLNAPNLYFMRYGVQR